MRADPADVQFSVMKTDERSSPGESTVCITRLTQFRTLHLYNHNGTSQGILSPENSAKLVHIRKNHNIMPVSEILWFPIVEIHTTFSNLSKCRWKSTLFKVMKMLFLA